jgi:hypothetical protein
VHQVALVPRTCPTDVAARKTQRSVAQRRKYTLYQKSF